MNRKSLIQPGASLVDTLVTPVEKSVNLLQKFGGRRVMPWFFIAPNMLLFAVFVFIPILLAVCYAFTGGTNILLWDRPYVGLQNFATLLSCEQYTVPATCEQDLFWTGVYNTVSFTFFNVTCTLGVALVTALILNRKIIARGFFRAIFFYPVLLSPVVVGLVWQWFLNRNGLLNLLLSSLGGQPITFLLEPSLARFWVVFVSVWFHVGFYTLILLAGLQAIPRDIYEAAAVDGTSRWRGFYCLTLPLLAPNILVVVILLTINSVQIFDEAWVLTNGGGPGTANNFIVQYIYQTAFSSNASLYGLASAASVLMGLVLMILTALQFLLTRRLEGKK
ncbi:sugar ABC transporter permease [Dickeya dadantii]|uniref:carbohydrate ABC transporter permease n=1 Tax=Dickeya dadantii TaxID=204038 RepID=UPI001495D3C9|nr:sugar ABC transporter permease [Dickeya dadantii]NPE54333.1 sugar ABC transporter permease [Dickeya dadantii]NPE66361.1 sugar ABC transporter permease [Dickeya dadantii]